MGLLEERLKIWLTKVYSQLPELVRVWVHPLGSPSKPSGRQYANSSTSTCCTMTRFRISCTRRWENCLHLSFRQFASLSESFLRSWSERGWPGELLSRSYEHSVRVVVLVCRWSTMTNIRICIVPVLFIFGNRRKKCTYLWISHTTAPSHLPVLPEYLWQLCRL